MHMYDTPNLRHDTTFLSEQVRNGETIFELSGVKEWLTRTLGAETVARFEFTHNVTA